MVKLRHTCIIYTGKSFVSFKLKTFTIFFFTIQLFNVGKVNSKNMYLRVMGTLILKIDSFLARL